MTAAEMSLTMDAFALSPLWKSAIGGLGGTEPGSVPGYVFHTAYVAANSGPVTFTVAFAGLRATFGSIRLSVYASDDETVEVAPAKEITVSLADLAARGGDYPLAIDARPGCSYAVLGFLLGESDATASGLAVCLDRWGDDSVPAARLARARRAVFGQPSAVGRRWWNRSSPLDRAGLISRESATLADPVSQMCTAAQFDEPDYARWLARLGMPRHLHRKQWEFVYILRVLEKYGALAPGKSGLGFGCGAEYLPSLFAALGCTIVATDLPGDSQQAAGWTATGQHADTLAALHWPSLCPEDLFAERVRFRAADMNAIPDDLRGFDFCWSACAYEHLGSIAAGLRFFRESVRCLRPGGIAVHTTELNLSSNGATVDNEATVLFRRRDIEQLAHDLLAEGHEVMTIKYDQGDRPLDTVVDMPPYRPDEHLKLALRQHVTTSFGLVARRGG